MDLVELDDNVLERIMTQLPWADIGSLFAVNKAWQRSLDSRDAMWLALLDQLEEHWAHRPGGAEFRACVAPAARGACCADSSASNKNHTPVRQAHPPRRQSKRLKQSGRQKLAAAVQARKFRSGELSTMVTFLLRQDILTVARLRKEIRSRMPVNLDFQDFSGFSILNLVYAFAPSRWFALATELVKNQGASPCTADLDGMTPLMTAAANGNQRGVQLLLEHGAAATLSWAGAHPEGWKRVPKSGISNEEWARHPASSRFPGRHTAMQWAELYGHQACVKLLAGAMDKHGIEVDSDT